MRVCACASFDNSTSGSCWGFSVLTQVFPVEGNLPCSLHHFPPHMPYFTKQVGASLPCSAGYSRLLSPDGLGRRVQRQDPPGARTPTTEHIILYLMHLSHMLFSTATSSE